MDYTIEMVKDLRDGNHELNGWIRYNDSKVMRDNPWLVNCKWKPASGESQQND